MQKLVTISFLLLINSFISLAQVPSYIPTNGLVGWWPFNGNANDESGNNNHGIPQNGTVLSNDRYGNSNRAYSFDGVNDYMSTPVLQNNINSYSVSVWFKTTDLDGWLFQGSRNCSTSIGTRLILGYGKLLYGADAPAYNDAVATNNFYNDNTWHNVVGVWNGVGNSTISQFQFSVYVDGVLVSQTPQTSVANGGIGGHRSIPINGSSTCSFGKESCNTSTYYYSGILDDIGIWNRALSQQEITLLYTSCTTPTATITPQSNTNFCQGNNVVLNATNGTNYTYEWYKNSSLINGATTNSYAATTAGNYTVKVIDGSCNATSSATTLTLIDTVTWTGNVDNDWHKPCNWSPEVVPECCNSVKIPLTPISPVVSGVGKAKNVTLYSTSGATLTVNNGANLQIETCPVNKTENTCPSLPVLTTTVISSVTQTTAVSGGNITYTGSSSITARGVCWSTTTAPTISNPKTTDGSGIGIYTSNLTGLTAGTTYYLRAFATNSTGTSYGNEVSFISQPAYAVGSVFCNGTPTYVQDVTNPITGKTWMDRNLGASQVATSSTDINAYGDLYQWGRRSDGHQCRTSTTTSTLSSIDQPANGNFIKAPNSPWDWRSPQNTNLWQGVNGINNPCPSGYRLPTELELDAERISWSSTNSLGALSSPLKFTIGGRREFNTASFINLGITGYYWTSDYLGIYSKYLEFNSGGGNMNNFSRALSFSVRCIKN